MPEVNKPLDSRIRRWIADGVPTADAVRIAVGGSIPTFAKRHGIHRTVASMAIYGKRFPTPADVLAGLVAELGGTEDEWRHLLYEGATPDCGPARLAS